MEPDERFGIRNAELEYDDRIRYNSVTAGPHRPGRAGGGVNESEVHVVYQTEQVYPAYIVTFHCKPEDAAALAVEDLNKGGAASGGIPGSMRGGNAFVNSPPPPPFAKPAGGSSGGVGGGGGSGGTQLSLHRAQATKAIQNTITIRVTDKTGEITLFKVKYTTKMQEVFDAWEKRRIGLVPHVFTFYGESVHGDQTPGQLGMKDQDLIHLGVDQGYLYSYC